MTALIITILTAALIIALLRLKPRPMPEDEHDQMERNWRERRPEWQRSTERQKDSQLP